MSLLSHKLQSMKTKRVTEIESNYTGPNKVKTSKKSSFNINFRCRICLAEGNIPIYGSKDSPEISNDIKTFGDIELSEEDNFPKYICQECNLLLHNAIKFRKTAKESQDTLKISVTNLQFHISEVNDSHFDEHETNDSEDNNLVPDAKTRRYECNICSAHFESSKDYLSHKKLHKRNVRVQCKLCPNLITVGKYKRHLKRHETPTHLICEVCGKTFRKDNLIRHVEMHGKKLPYQCSKCPYRARLRDSLKIHMRCHTGNKPYSCNKCQAKFITCSNLNRHLLTHSKERSYKCIECGRSFYTKYDMDTHFKSEHSGINFGCISCGNKYGSRKALLRHELQAHKRDKMPRGRKPLYLQEDYKATVNS